MFDFDSTGQDRRFLPFSRFFVLLALLLALAAPGWAVDVTYQEGSWDVTAKTVNFTEKTANNPTLVTDTDLNDNGSNKGWYYVSGDVNIGERIFVQGTVNLILCDGAKLTATNGITVYGNDTLNIYGQTAGTGKLVATGGDFGAGIGASGIGGTVTIHGGVIEANGSNNAAGIGGGGLEGIGGPVTIYGGTVTATGNKGGAGIGGGQEGSGGPVNIYGGIVEANGSDNGAGIGGGLRGSSGTVTITGGRVTANGGKNAAGIGGGGYVSQGGTVKITGGTVTARGGDEGGAGIGGGNSSNGGEVEITGGTVTATGNNGGAGIGKGGNNGNPGTLKIGTGVRLYGGDNAQNLLAENDTGKNLDYPDNGERPQDMMAVKGVLVKDLGELLKELQEEPGKTRNDDIVITKTIEISRDVTLDGKGRTISGLGKGNCRVFSISGDNTVTVNISNLNITGGTTTGDGGGVYVKDVTVNLNNCSLYGNTARSNDSTTGRGGGLYVINASVNMTHCSIYGNTAGVVGATQAGYGGGVYAENATVNMTHCSIYDNAAIGNCGGGVRAYGSTTLNMINCTVTGNKTEGGGNGGGVYAGDDNAGTYPTVNMVNCTLANNATKDSTGAMGDGAEISAVRLNAVNTVFWNETATKAYVSCNVDGPNFSLNLYSCAYGPEAIDNKVIPDGNCFTVSNWSNTPEDVEVRGVKHRVFPLTKGNQLIGKGLTSGDVVGKLELDDTTALATDQLGHTRNSTPDIGAWEYVSVEGVTLKTLKGDPGALTVGGTVELSVDITPVDAVDKTVKWTTSNADIAAVDENTGVVTAKAVGTATITAIANSDENVSADRVVTVKEATPAKPDTPDTPAKPDAPDKEPADEKKEPASKKGESYAPAFDLKTVESLIREFFGDGVEIFVLSKDVATLSGDRSPADLDAAQLREVSSDQSVILAVLPEITPEVTAVFVLGVSFDITPEGTLKWHGFPQNTENNVALAADEEDCLFLDDNGEETKTAPANGHVNAVVKLTEGVTYAPVITAETSTAPTSDKGSGGCNAGLGIAGLLAIASVLPHLRRK